MGIPLRVLMVEDSEDDVLLIQHELNRGGFSVQLKRVETSREMRTVLEEESWDIVISDYNLPGFNGIAALQVLKQVGLDLPFFLVSGAVREEIAVDAMQSGAQDYVKKDNLARLIPAIHRELREAKVRREHTHVQEMLHDSEERYETLIENIPVGVFRSVLNENAHFSMANPAFISMFGFSDKEAVKKSSPQEIFASPEEYDLFCRMLRREVSLNGVEMRMIRSSPAEQTDKKDPQKPATTRIEIWGLVTAKLNHDPLTNQEYIDCVIEDITQRKRSEELKDALYQITQASNTTRSLDDLIKAFHRIIRGLMPAENIYLAMYDPFTRLASYPYFFNENEQLPDAESIGRGLTTYIIQTGESLLGTPEINASLLENGLLEETDSPSFDWIGVPLHNPAGTTIGALVVQTYDTCVQYTENEQRILAYVSSHIALAIERKKSEDALRISESKQRALLEAIPDVIILVDQQGLILECKFPSTLNKKTENNTSSDSMSGLRELLNSKDCVGFLLSDFFSAETTKSLMAGIHKVLLTSESSSVELETTLPKSGGGRNFEARLTLSLPADLLVENPSFASTNPPQPPQVLLLIRDVTEERNSEQRAEAQRAFLRQVIDINPNFIFAKDNTGRFTLANQAVADAYGTTVDDLIGKTDADINPSSEEVVSFQKDDREVINTLREKTIPEEKVTVVNGKSRWMQTVKRPLILPDRNEVYVLGVSTDITERKRAVEQILHNAFHDLLTGLPNRALLLDRLDRVIERSRRHHDVYYAILLMDLDRFAVINDSLGHRMGDHLLMAMADRLLGIVRPVDTVARIGGDEFVILLEDLENLAVVTQLAEQILMEMQLPLMVRNQKVVVSTSMGIVLGGSTYELPEDIMRDADIALNRAKTTGKSKYAIFDNVMRANILAHLELDNDLRRALENNELEVHFEPIISLLEPNSGQALTFEALVRWRHPTRGLVTPSQFIPFAEETGLILPIGEWVLMETCRHLSKITKTYPWTAEISVSVNISSRQFAQPMLVPMVERILKETGLDAARLCLEITESVLMENADVAIAALKQLQDIGIQIYVDDFGTGYSSLYYLHRLPLNVIKIDRTFISGGEFSTSRAEIIETIVRLANSLKLTTIAEGVETKDQLAKVKALGLDFVQGKLFSPTLAPDAFEEFIASKNNQINWVAKRLSEK